MCEIIQLFSHIYVITISPYLKLSSLKPKATIVLRKIDQNSSEAVCFGFLYMNHIYYIFIISYMPSNFYPIYRFNFSYKINFKCYKERKYLLYSKVRSTQHSHHPLMTALKFFQSVWQNLKTKSRPFPKRSIMIDNLKITQKNQSLYYRLIKGSLR